MKSTEATAVPNAFSFRKHCPHVDIWGIYSCTNTEPFTRNKMNMKLNDNSTHTYIFSKRVKVSYRYIFSLFKNFLN